MRTRVSDRENANQLASMDECLAESRMSKKGPLGELNGPGALIGVYRYLCISSSLGPRASGRENTSLSSCGFLANETIPKEKLRAFQLTVSQNGKKTSEISETTREMNERE